MRSCENVAETKEWRRNLLKISSIVSTMELADSARKGDIATVRSKLYMNWSALLTNFLSRSFNSLIPMLT